MMTAGTQTMIVNSSMMTIMKTGIPNNENLKTTTTLIIEAGTRKIRRLPPKQIPKNPRKKVIPESRTMTRRITVKTNAVPIDHQDP